MEKVKINLIIGYYKWNDEREYFGDWKANKMEGEGSSYGLMVGDMKAIIRLIKKKDLVYLNGKLCKIIFLGQMEDYIRVIGRMENNMGKGNFIILHVLSGKRDYGMKGKELSGSKIELLFKLK
jgi:hypothetical protein